MKKSDLLPEVLPNLILIKTSGYIKVINHLPNVCLVIFFFFLLFYLRWGWGSTVGRERCEDQMTLNESDIIIKFTHPPFSMSKT